MLENPLLIGSAKKTRLLYPAGSKKRGYYHRDHDGRLAKTPHRSLNFEQYASEGNRFINEVALDLHVDRNTAARVTRAVLHALRDRIPPDDAIQFAQGLPMALKGIFIDQYDISQTPVVIRRGERFLDFIYSKAGITAPIDFPYRRTIGQALSAVFFTLENHMDEGQTDQIKNILGHEIVDLIYMY